MLLVATFLTVHFGEWRSHWHGMPNKIKTGISIFEDVPRENEGGLAIFEYESGRCLHSVRLDTPAGFAFGREALFVNSMHGNQTVCLDRALRPVDSVSNRMMSDLHSLVATGDRLLLTSSGVDGILEMTLDGRLVWAWFAREHGYAENPMGFRPRVDKKADYRMQMVDTGAQTTHCNSAIGCEIRGRPSILSTLFHQGELVAIDRATGAPETLVTGMSNPHSIRRRAGGWMVCDSRAGAVVLLDESFRVTDMIEADFNWVQDCIQLPNGNLLIGDANNSRMVEWSILRRCPVRELGFPSEWKIYQMESAGADWSDVLVRAASQSSSIAAFPEA
jgi:hypothetical protein